MSGSEIVFRKFISKDTALQFFKEFDEIENESDEMEQKARVIELAKKVLDFLEDVEEDLE